mmetsp:Transcript_71666/g.124445  ORF Transcript_71666/g.124445 Transcript_71666/m.124445 type:complete len:84 (+) Transcript_71666:163-414(+)
MPGMKPDGQHPELSLSTTSTGSDMVLDVKSEIFTHLKNSEPCLYSFRMSCSAAEGAWRAHRSAPSNKKRAMAIGVVEHKAGFP